MAILKKINVVFLYVVDFEGMREFYETTLGLGKPLYKTRDWVEYALPGGGAHFGLHRTLPENMEGCDRSRNSIKFSVVVDDLQAAYHELTDQGVRFIRAPEKGFGFDLCEFEDPEGNQIRLLQFTTMKRAD
ncbi:MAG: VOC family protein [bacterium]|nr:VOC family protein [bacterium]